MMCLYSIQHVVVVGGCLIEIPQEIALRKWWLCEVLPDDQPAHAVEIRRESDTSSRAKGQVVTR